MTDAPEPMFLMLKRDLYECPDHCGYTGVKDRAGRYTLADVATSIGPDKYTPLNEEHYFIKEEDAPEYTHKCFWDVREAHLKEKIEALTTEIKRCHERLEIDHKYRMKLMCYAVIIGWTLYIYNTDVFQAYAHGLLGL